MDIKTIINSIGLLITIIGVWMVYKGSPIHYDIISGGDDSTNWKEVSDTNEKENNRVKNGVRLIIIGTAFQLISNFIPSCNSI